MKLDLAAMLARKDKVVETLTNGVDGLFKKNKITRYLGTARLAGAGQGDRRDQRRPSRAHGQAHHHRHRQQAGHRSPASSSTATASARAPRRSPTTRCPSTLVVIGGGYIGLELGTVWNRLGAK